MLLVPLLVVGFVLIVLFFLSWYVVVVVERVKKTKFKRVYYVLWGIGIPLAVGGLAMIIAGLIVK